MPGHRILQTLFGACNFLAIYADPNPFRFHAFLVSGITHQWLLQCHRIVYRWWCDLPASWERDTARVLPFLPQRGGGGGVTKPL